MLTATLGHLLALASVTDSLVKLATSLIGSLGLAGVALLTATSGVIGTPGSEPTMLFAGFNVYQGRLTLFGIIAFGVVGDVVGAAIAYAIGYFGRRELVERQGAKLKISANGLLRAERWFQRRGTIVILLSRVLPFVRAAVPYAAGVARIPFARFVALATAGSIVWIGALGLLGREVGRNWPSWRQHLGYVDYAALALLVLGIVYLLVRRSRTRSDGSGAEGTEHGETEQMAVDVVGQ